MTVKTFLVGGSIRDEFLGRKSHDLDYVITGADAEYVEHMVTFAGFTRVGADFPVFLHPETGCEYALARTERKVSAGYGGFETYTSPELTIYDDLARRDFTMNAMAKRVCENGILGSVLDPYDGIKDIETGFIRHVGPSFVEDPLRILRAARFAAQLNFRVADETLELMRDMVSRGVLAELSRERIWVEFEKMLNADYSMNGIDVLSKIGALKLLFNPNIYDVSVFYYACNVGPDSSLGRWNKASAISKFAYLMKDCKISDKDLFSFKMPTGFMKGYQMFHQMQKEVIGIRSKSPHDILMMLKNLGLLGNSKTFDNLDGAFNIMHPYWAIIRNDIKIAQSYCLAIDNAAIAKEYNNGKEVALQIYFAREYALSVMIANWNKNENH